MKENKSRKDPLTGEIFVPKKVTQRFKNRVNQIKFNNQKQSARRAFLGILLKPLTKTHRILTEALGGEDTVTLHREWLEGAGADMTLFTHIETIDENSFQAIFNFKITSKDEYYVITKLSNYENSNL